MFKFLIDWLKSKKTFDFYLAGGMRGYENLNKPMFTLISTLLRLKGFTVWSPSEQKSYLQLSFSRCMTLDLNRVINNCRKIALIPGWRESLGANMEAFSAFACGKETIEIVLNEDKTDVTLICVDLSKYQLPYQTGKTCSFNPHKCNLDSFIETEE